MQLVQAIQFSQSNGQSVFNTMRANILRVAAYGEAMLPASFS
jgi:hypothetical protein